MSGGMWEPEGGKQTGEAGRPVREDHTAEFGHPPPKARKGHGQLLEATLAPHRAGLEGQSGDGGVLRKVPHLRKKHRRRREVDGFGTCLASTKRTCGETASGRDGSGARRTLRFLSWEHGTQGERGTP